LDRSWVDDGVEYEVVDGVDDETDGEAYDGVYGGTIEIAPRILLVTEGKEKTSRKGWSEDSQKIRKQSYARFTGKWW